MKIVLRNIDSNYLGFKKGHDPEVWVSTTVGGYETFILKKIDDKTFSIKNKDGDYLTIFDKKPFVKVSSSESTNERFSIQTINNCFVNICNKDGYTLGFKRTHKPKFWASKTKGSYEKVSFIDQSRWMTLTFPKIKELKLGDLMLIGAHNSAMNRKQLTFNWGGTAFFWQDYINQYYSIDEQFAGGCRYFELRLSNVDNRLRGFHGYTYTGLVRTTSNAKYQLNQLARKIGDKELIILDLERTNKYTIDDFIALMKKLFGNKIIYRHKAKEKFGIDTLANFTVQQLVSLGNVILMTDEAKDSCWSRKENLISAWKEKGQVKYLIPELEDDVKNHPGHFDNAIWIHDAYLTGNALKDKATEAAPDIRKYFMEWKKTGFRVNTVKIDFVNDRGNSALMDEIVSYYMTNKSDHYREEGSSFYLPQENVPGTKEFYRIYRAYGLGDHMYTASEEEKNSLLQGETNCLQKSIGFIFESRDEGKEMAPLHRLFNNVWNDHLYTIDESEKEHLIKHQWVYEGIAGYVYTKEEGNAKLIRRFYREYTRDHLYTADEQEIVNLRNIWAAFEKIIKLLP